MNQACGTALCIDNFNNTNYTHSPFYGSVDPAADYANKVITGITNPANLNCTITTINSPWWFVLPFVNPISTTTRRTDSYRLAQSCVSQIITNPLTNAAFTNISPRFQLNGSRIIPTFIVHGTKDRVVPYAYSTDGMSTALTNFGGLIGTYSNTSGPAIPASNLYSTYTSKHIIKLFTNADHDVANNVQTQPDILTWINGHK